MKKQIIISVFTLLFVFAAHGLSAQSPVGKKQVRQQHRITQGLTSGELTVPEYARLQRQQMRIQRQKRVYKSDGVVTLRERASLHRHQKRASQNIYRQKHDLTARPF